MSGARILKSSVPSTNLPEKTAHSVLVDSARRHAEKIYLIEYKTGKSFTFGQLADDSLKLANALKKLGLTPGDVFLLYGYNCYELFMAFLAGLLVGGVGLSVRGQDTHYELLKAIETRNAKWVFVQNELRTVVGKICEQSPNCKIFIFDTPTTEDCRVTTIRELIEDAEPLPENQFFVPQDVRRTPAMIIESSGTTGPAKGALISHFSLASYTSTAPETQNQLDLIVSPLAHSSCVAYLLRTMAAGWRILVLREYDNDVVLEAIQNYRVQRAILFPLTINYLTKKGTSYDISCLEQVFVGGSKLLTTTAKAFHQKYKPKVFMQAYAMTETATVVSRNNFSLPESGRIKYESVGKVQPSVEVRIVDVKTNEMLGPNKTGEIHVRTSYLFLGYHNEPEKTKAAIDDEGWYHTSDIGYYDEEEDLYLVDRMKDILDVDGYHFPAADLEEVLMSHEAVADACVVGIPKDSSAEDAGELAHAFVIRNINHDVTEEELKSYVNERITRLKRLGGNVHFVSDFPLTSFGKVKRNALRNNYVKKNSPHGT